MAKRHGTESVTKVGKYEFSVSVASPTPESAERWERRSETLAAMASGRMEASRGGQAWTAER